MRANRLTLLLLGLLCFCCAGTLFAQQEIKVSTLAVSDYQGEPLVDAFVTYTIDGDTEVAPTNGEAFYYVLADEAKASIVVEHPLFGTNLIEMQLPKTGSGTIQVMVGEDGAEAKFFPNDRIWPFFYEPFTGTPVPPPPGNGCQLPNQINAYGTDSTNPPFLVADDFCPENDDDLTHLVFWGGYLNICFGGDCGPGPGDSFTITYYNDAGGCTGSVLAGPFAVGLTQKFATGNLIAGFVAEYQYQTTFHAPVPVTAGQKVWVEIVNNTAGDSCCAWYWETSSDGNGAACSSQVPTPLPGDDMAFCTNVLIAPCPGPPGPDNDDCGNCEAISGEGLFSFDNTNASTDGPEDILCDKFGSQQVDNDVWYCWTAPCDGTVVVETCSLTAVDTKIAAYDGTSCPPGAALDCNDDTCSLQSHIEFTATSGNSYLIRIGTFPGASGGTGQFSITCGGGPGGPANDDCGNCEALSVPGSVSATTIGSQADPEAFLCTTSVTGPGVWYCVTGTGNTMTATTCNAGSGFDTKLHVYCGDCSGLICVAGNDDSCGAFSGLLSTVSWCSISGQEYRIFVHGFGGATGAFQLDVTDDGVACNTPVACAEPPLATLDVTANIPGVFVQLSPIDIHNQGAGLTPFSRTYNLLTEVQMTAPTSWEHNSISKDLMGWLINDRVVRPNRGTLRGIITEYKKVKAFYSEGDVSTDGDVLHGR